MPHIQRLRRLLIANPARQSEFVMVSTRADDGGGDYYIGVPSRTFLAGFDGFEVIDEKDLPNDPQAYLVGDFSKSRWAGSTE